MRTQKKFLPYLYFFFASLVPLMFYILFVNPDSSFTFFDFLVTPAIFFFGMFFLTLFFLFTFIFASQRRGVLISLFFTGVLVLRFVGLRSIFQVIVLLAILLLVEYFYLNNRGHKKTS